MKAELMQNIPLNIFTLNLVIMREGGNYFRNNYNVLHFTHSPNYMRKSLINKVIDMKYLKMCNKLQTLQLPGKPIYEPNSWNVLNSVQTQIYGNCN